MAIVEFTQVEEAVGLITLIRPERLNALTFELVADLHTALDDAGGRSDLVTRSRRRWPTPAA